ncbi:hypothetical protein ON010_g12693 [Phytophthora cinnamomi]|nr:hypothetical protein ON010_g12693 [Phytophthora cinnamomi]
MPKLRGYQQASQDPAIQAVLPSPSNASQDSAIQAFLPGPSNATLLLASEELDSILVDKYRHRGSKITAKSLRSTLAVSNAKDSRLIL